VRAGFIPKNGNGKKAPYGRARCCVKGEGDKLARSGGREGGEGATEVGPPFKIEKEDVNPVPQKTTRRVGLGQEDKRG